jgi:transketolase
MRWTFQQCLYDLMKRDPRTHLLWGDVGLGLFKKHREDFPSRVLNVGVCEQSTVSMAAGMAMQGLRPICYTITPFLIERAFEQIKIDVDQMRQPVLLVGHSDDKSGPTHQELCAATLMGLCRNIHSHFPTTNDVLREIMFALNLDEPNFIALRTIE